MKRVLLPNLQEEKRIGVTNILSVSDLCGRDKEGEVNDLIVFQIPSAVLINRQNLLELLKRNKNSVFFTMHGGEEKKLSERILFSFFTWRALLKEPSQDFSNSSFYLLSNYKNDYRGKFSPISGPSGTLSLYLVLLSSY